MVATFWQQDPKSFTDRKFPAEAVKASALKAVRSEEHEGKEYNAGYLTDVIISSHFSPTTLLNPTSSPLASKMQASKAADARARFNSRLQSQPRPVRHQTPDVLRYNNEEQQKQWNGQNKKFLSEMRESFISMVLCSKKNCNAKKMKAGK